MLYLISESSLEASHERIDNIKDDMIAKIDSVIVVVVAKIEVRHTMVDDLNSAACVMRTKLEQEFLLFK